MQNDIINERDELILRADSNLTAIGLYVNKLEDRLASFMVTRSYMSIRKEKCADSKLETALLEGKIDSLKIVLTNFKGGKDELEVLVDMVTR